MSSGKIPKLLELVPLTMQWGLTAENAEHIKQTKTAGSWETLHGNQVTLNDSVSVADISGLSFALCCKGLEPCEV